MPDPLFQTLYREAEKIMWSPSDDIRRRARQRTMRQRAVLAAAAFVTVFLVSVAAVAFAGRPFGPPADPASQSQSPSVTATPPSPTGSAPAATPVIVFEVGPEAILRPGDAGAGTWTEGIESSDWRLSYLLGLCQADVDPVPAIGHRGQNLERAGTDDGVAQGVEAYAEGNAEMFMTKVRANLLACAHIDNQLSGGPITLTVTRNAFAGEDSVLFAVTSRNGTRHNALVRVGNLITELSVYPDDEANLVAVAGRAAARMCALTRTC
jgi:hypothetical protein